jgi:hypothetical protein
MAAGEEADDEAIDHVFLADLPPRDLARDVVDET